MLVLFSKIACGGTRSGFGLAEEDFIAASEDFSGHPVFYSLIISLLYL